MQERQAATDSGPVALVTTTAFPVLHLKIPIKIADLSSFAETTLAMIISHKALHRVTRLLRLIPVSSRMLLGMFLSAQGVTDDNLLECKYASTWSRNHRYGHFVMPHFLYRFRNLCSDIPRLCAASFAGRWNSSTRSSACG